MAQILICDDDLTFQLALRATLARDGLHGCKWAKNSEEAALLLRRENFDLLLLDIEMRSSNEGLEYLPRVRQEHPQLPILMCSGRSGFEDVRRAMLEGAWDYIRKDFDPEHLIHTVDQLLLRSRERREAALAQAELARSAGRASIVGESAPIEELRGTLAKFARSMAPVLIVGETGTGKELAARALRPTRSDGSLSPFVAVDSATLAESTAEAKLFGHEKGAFTGADRSRPGLFEQADGGVLFFDELGNMPLSIQQKLLRVLQEKEVVRMGASRALKLEFRVVAATNRDLHQMVRDGTFLHDLLQRLEVLPLRIPPLRERRTDIPVLARAFLDRLGGGRWTDEAMELLTRYEWPGNIRELQNVVEYAVTMSERDPSVPSGVTLDVGDLPERIRASASYSGESQSSQAVGFYQRMLEHEATLLREALSRPHGSVTALAATLGMDRSHLYTKLRQHGLKAGSSGR